MAEAVVQSAVKQLVKVLVEEGKLLWSAEEKAAELVWMKRFLKSADYFENQDEIGVSPLLKTTLRRLNSLADVDESTHRDKMEILDAALRDFVAVIEVVGRREFGHKLLVTDWLQDIHDMFDVVNDLIDEFELEAVQMKNNHLPVPNQVSLSLSRLNPFSSNSKFTQPLHPIRLALSGVVQGMARLSITARDAQLLDRYPPPAHPYVSPEGVVGRGSDEKAVVDLILKCVASSELDRVSVVPIVGSFGVGKTALANLIFHSEIINAKFDHKLWSCLDKADCHDIRPFLEELIQDRIGGDDIDEMKMELQESLQNKRFLVVLDALEDINLHKSLARELIDMGSDSTGCAIIVTTRSRRAAALIGTTPAYHLKPLPLDASYLLLTKMAVEGNQTDHEIEPIARKIAKQCGGVPSLLVSIGGLLWTKDTTKEWTQVLEEAFIIKTFKNSADMRQLPPEMNLLLKSFCLQKTCGLSVEALICVWMALGFLYSDDPTQQPERIGREYLRDIVETPLCPDVEYAPGGVVRHIKFNDVLFDCITSTVSEQWFMQRGKSSQEPGRFARYIIWNKYHLQGPILDFHNKVRLFILNIRGQASAKLVRDIVYHFKCLRVLGLGGCDIETLPDSIGQLTNLRYLDVGKNARMKRLPDSICDLWFLQTLFLHGCSQLQVLPENIGRLQNLRYLTLTILEQSLPEAIGQLTSLRTLALASCPRLASLPSTLKNLKNLQTLGIVDCQELDLAAYSSVEGLMGMDALHTLLLSHLPKFASLPTDLGDLSVAMKHLLIQSCPGLTAATWITQFRSLCSLTIEDCPKLSALTLTESTSQLKSLVELVIRRCPSLAYTAWIWQFMSLRSLVIDGCPKLVKLDAAFSELKKLERVEVRWCPRLTAWFASPAGKDWCKIVHARVIELDGVHLES